ncbi:MAG: hypothetical protein K2L05_04225 [Muribaculaceae bacterium]|nr:hypothetical protein [Muribaculaceae bacterium]
MRLHLFNPENDLALAAGTVNYTPPASVVRFRTALAALPAWLADEGDNILAPGLDPRWLEANGLNVGLIAEGQPAPWGWSAHAVSLFRRAGSEGPFPDVEAIRRLSHRRTALLLHRELQGRLSYPLPPAPLEISNIADMPAGRDWFLKAPWSCSGRGVVDCCGLSPDVMLRRAADTIRRQGSVMVEPRLEKIRDFAMLFEATDGGVIYRGLSLFFNAGPTAYGGNIIAPEDELAAELNAPYLAETATEVTRAMTAIIGNDYRGPFGVDMMLYGPDRLICPTVEVNLRTTMGFLALALRRRHPRAQIHERACFAVP